MRQGEEILNKKFASAIYEIYELDGSTQISKILKEQWEALNGDNRNKTAYIEKLEDYLEIRRIVVHK